MTPLQEAQGPWGNDQWCNLGLATSPPTHVTGHMTSPTASANVKFAIIQPQQKMRVAA